MRKEFENFVAYVGLLLKQILNKQEMDFSISSNWFRIW
jgi:hypothetical protein